MQTAIKTKEGLGIEYDENIVCDVCQVVTFFLQQDIFILLYHVFYADYVALSQWFSSFFTTQPILTTQFNYSKNYTGT